MRELSIVRKTNLIVAGPPITTATCFIEALPDKLLFLIHLSFGDRLSKKDEYDPERWWGDKGDRISEKDDEGKRRTKSAPKRQIPDLCEYDYVECTHFLDPSCTIPTFFNEGTHQCLHPIFASLRSI